MTDQQRLTADREAAGSPRLSAVAPRGLARAFEQATGKSTFWVAVILLALLVIFGALRFGQFVTVFNFQTLASNAAVLIVMSIGQTYVLITANIDLSVGSVLVFSSIISGKVMLALSGAPSNSYGTITLSWPLIFVGAIISVAGGVLWGLFNGVITAYTRVPSLIVTLGSFGMALGLAEIISGGTDVRGVPQELVDTIGTGTVAGVPVLVVIAIIIIAIAGIALQQTVFGRRTFAIGSNLEAARRAGIKVKRHIVWVFVLSGALAGIAGFMSMAQFGTTTLAGHSIDNLNTIAAAVIGGTSLFGGVGTILGAVIGVFIPAVLQNGFVIMGVQPFWQEVVVGAILVGAVYVDTERRRKRIGE